MAGSSGPKINTNGLQLCIDGYNLKSPSTTTNVKNLASLNPSIASSQITYIDKMLNIANSESLVDIPLSFSQTEGVTVVYTLKFPSSYFIPFARYDLLLLEKQIEETDNNISFRWIDNSIRQNNINISIFPSGNNAATVQGNVYNIIHVRKPNGFWKNFLNGKLTTFVEQNPAFLEITNPIALNFNKFIIGIFTPTDVFNNGALVQAQVNNIMVYNRAFTDAEVLECFNAFRTRYNYKY